jgi:hypothetical protein
MVAGEQAAADRDFDADFAVEWTLNTCRDANDWAKMFAKHPGVLGMTRATGDEDLAIACSAFPDTRVCEGRH